MATPVMFKMKKEDLEYIVEQRAGLLGTSGTGSGDPTCDGTVVHCCFRDMNKVIRSQDVESGYALSTERGLFEITIDQG